MTFFIADEVVDFKSRFHTDEIYFYVLNDLIFKYLMWNDGSRVWLGVRAILGFDSEDDMGSIPCLEIFFWQI